MNKYKLILVVLCTAFMLSSCVNAQNNIYAETLSTEQVDLQDLIEDNFECETESLGDSQNDIELKYPKMISSDEDTNSFVNNEIKTSVDEFKDRWILDSLEGELTLELDYEITYYSERFISIVFKGYGNRTISAHPNYDTFSLNLDLDKKCKKTLSQLVEINDDFISKFENAITKTELAEFSEEIISNDIENLLKNTDTKMSHHISYFLGNEVIIAIYFPYVVGDYVEIHIER